MSSDIRTTLGKRYVLIPSRNEYEQRTTETDKRTETGFNALPCYVREVTANGGLGTGGVHMCSFEALPMDARSARLALKKYSTARR